MFLTYLHVNHKWQWLYRPLHWFVATIHDVPAVVLMMFFYYVVFSASLNGILVSIIALGVYTSGTLTKIFKIHIKQVGKEQYEAGRMLGFTPKQIYRLIILPQAVKSMLPLVVGEMKVLLRATSYAGYIAQKDLVKAVDSIRTQTEDVFLPLLFISLLYLFLSWLIVKVFHLLHVKLFCYD
jgi:glutamate transport system permease protein